MCDHNPVSRYPLTSSDAASQLLVTLCRCLIVMAAHVMNPSAPKFQVLLFLAASGSITWINLRFTPYAVFYWNYMATGKTGGEMFKAVGGRSPAVHAAAAKRHSSP